MEEITEAEAAGRTWSRMFSRLDKRGWGGWGVVIGEWGRYGLLKCHNRENDIDIHSSFLQLTTVERTVFDFLENWKPFYSFPILFPLSLSLPHPHLKMSTLLSSSITLANTLLNYHVLSGYPISIKRWAFLLPAVVNSMVAKGEIRY